MLRLPDWLRRARPRDPESSRRILTPEEEARRAARRAEMDELARDPSFLLTTQSFPIYYLPITKCGCTFLKNLFYALDHGKEHPDGIFIHDGEEGLIRADASAEAEVKASPYVFTVLRDPVDRFVSMYFDKIWGEGEVNFPRIRAHLEEVGVVDLSRDLDVEGHRANLARLLDWVADNLDGGTELAQNYHWRPQVSRVKRGRMFPVNHLTLEGLDWQLPLLVGPVIPDMAERMQAVKARNTSSRPPGLTGLVTEELASAIRQLYRFDTRLHARATARWAGQAPDRRPTRTPLAISPNHLRLTMVEGSAPPTGLGGAALSGVEWAVYALQRSGNALEPQDASREEIAAGTVRALAILRDPVTRLGAAYADLIAKRPASSLLPHLTVLERREDWTPDPQDTEAHRRNVAILLTFMRRRAEVFLDAGGHPETRFQTHDLAPLIDAGATPVAADRIHPDLTKLDGLVVEPRRMARAAAKIALDPGIADAFDPLVVETIRSLYRADQDLYERALPQDGDESGGDENGATQEGT
ncbi:sulfotransferase family 2 domain-containing protein [Roseobacter sp. HKCCA0434]|uniref:sulfotransferase family 2 domain-containing protein n=1 Tax=Roseobacter sp. HKCCA0434 TaxID=3079297 RepID=UPI0029059393|nr:sulfotransferase family 2 domain-containing protein [Roseobacter sp. HKCCA0434]